MDRDRKTILEAARAEAARMREALAGADETAVVTISSPQFGKIANLIDLLADSVDFWPEERLDNPRYWVPLGHFQRVKQEATHWESECGRLRTHQAFDELLRF